MIPHIFRLSASIFSYLHNKFKLSVLPCCASAVCRHHTHTHTFPPHISELSGPWLRPQCRCRNSAHTRFTFTQSGHTRTPQRPKKKPHTHTQHKLCTSRSPHARRSRWMLCGARGLCAVLPRCCNERASVSLLLHTHTLITTCISYRKYTTHTKRTQEV